MPRLPRFQHLQSHLCPAGSAITETIHQRVVGLACEQGVARGDKLRTDTTVVESHVHYPTDSSLLGDGIRVLSRSLQRIARECKNGALEVVDHGRAVKHRLLEISRAAKCLTEANQQRMRDSYQKLVGLTRRVVRQASAVVQRWGKGRLKVVGKLLRVETQIGPLRHFLPLVKKVIRPTKERVEGGNRHAEEKVLSLFEPHTEVIRKGKAHKPNEFGRLVRVDEVENGIVSGYQVLPGNAARYHGLDSSSPTTSSLLWASAGDGHWRPRIFLRSKRAGGASFGSKEGGAAGARTTLDHAIPATEATLVPTSAALAGRL
jgi:hypothetical protein